MPVDIVVGGQGGDEGKGKIAAYLAKEVHDYDIIMRVSKPQAGHSIHYKGKRIGLATLPCASIYSGNRRILIGRGAYINQERILEEIEKTGIDKSQLGIDENASIVRPEHIKEERENQILMGKIGSVGTGAGPATRDKIMRSASKYPNQFAKDIPELQEYLTNTTDEIHKILNQRGKILIEGDQGFKLSLIHGEYPYVTSCDTTASTILGKAGIGPLEVADIYIVFKPYATRVATGDLEDEILDEELLNWGHDKGGESGTISKRLRRMGWFEWENALKAIQINSANIICFTHMDWNYFGERSKDELITKKAKDFLEEAGDKLCTQYPHPQMSLISYGPETDDVKPYWFIRQQNDS